jgi:amino acid adenylation domain-containing protein
VSTVPHDVATWVELTPAAAAVEDPARHLTYGRLAARANAVADELRRQAVRPGDVVAIELPRSADYAAAILGVWQAGAVALPVDPTLPPERLRYQARQARVTQTLSAVPQAAGPERLRIGDVRAGDRAYIMFTSGSTGRPKGVEVSHASLRNCVHAVADLLRPDDRARYAANQTFAFDISLLELFLPLTHGGAVLVTSEALQAGPDRLVAWLEERGATVLHATPTAWRSLLPHLTPGRRELQAVCGGEPLNARLADELAGRAGRVWNFYGPTEVTVWCTAGIVGPAATDPVPVGRPLAGYRIHLLDRGGRPVPDGEQGEIHVGGRGLAVGYTGRPDLTAELFTEHPEYGRLYRTGDLGRMRADGQLQFDGRRDRQVQLGGYRIELGELESVAQDHPLVELAAAYALGDGLLLLVQGEVTGRALRKHLATYLPSYMIPSRIEALPVFPLTPTKKIDRAALLTWATGEEK